VKLVEMNSQDPTGRRIKKAEKKGKGGMPRGPISKKLRKRGGGKSKRESLKVIVGKKEAARSLVKKGTNIRGGGLHIRAETSVARNQKGEHWPKIYDWVRQDWRNPGYACKPRRAGHTQTNSEEKKKTACGGKGNSTRVNPGKNKEILWEAGESK